jgi:hypothetical protein
MSNADIATRRFYLIFSAQYNEYRLTGFITDTERDHHERTGWDVVSFWRTKPTMNAVQQAGYLHSVTTVTAA